MTNLETFTENIRQLVAKDDLKTAIIQVCQFLDKTPQLDEAIMLSARYNGLMKDIRAGVLYQETEEVSKNKLRRAVLDLVSSLEEETEEHPELAAEGEKALAENPSITKTNTQTITGDGNIGIQDVSGSTININQGK
ncbi:MAG: hypothetical protein AAF740_09160 [Bacteroidota bacterium]